MLDIIILLVIIVLVYLLAMKLFKSLFKATLLCSAFLIIALGTVAFMTYNDVAEMQENLPEQPNAILVEDNGNIVLAAEMTEMENQQKMAEEDDFPFRPIQQDKVELYNTFYQNNDLDGIKGDYYYRLLIINTDVLSEGLPATANVEFGNEQGFELTKAEVLYIIRNNDKEYIEELILSKTFDTSSYPEEQLEYVREEIKKQMKEHGMSPEIIRTLITAAAIQETLENKGAMYFFSEFQDSNIVIYPETITFKLLKRVPVSVVKKAADKMSMQMD